MFTSPEEEKFIFNYLNKDMKLLEYGSGESTIQFSHHVKEVVSIEHNENWFNKVFSKIDKNVNLHLCKPDLHYEEVIHDGTYEQFKTYITYPIKYGIFDVIFIDGRARIECAKFAKNLSNHKTMIFIHDFFSRLELDNYKKIYDYLILEEYVGEMAKFRVK